ncbi:MAG: CNP1-like family protein [Neisseria sp.]|nr:CNP1-like family protein [Neisseria sp.]
MRLILLPALLLAAHAQAAITSDKESDINQHYIETEADLNRKNFTEAQEGLPPYPAENTDWFELYIGPASDKKPAVSLSSVHTAADGTIRYILNNRSQRGADNISAEAIYCATTSFVGREGKKSSYKTYAYGDSVNKRWIEPRNPQWHDLGNTFEHGDPVRRLLLQVWCRDGAPADTGAATALLKRHGGRIPSSGQQDRWEK